MIIRNVTGVWLRDRYFEKDTDFAIVADPADDKTPIEVDTATGAKWLQMGWAIETADAPAVPAAPAKATRSAPVISSDATASTVAPASNAADEAP